MFAIGAQVNAAKTTSCRGLRWARCHALAQGTSLSCCTEFITSTTVLMIGRYIDALFATGCRAGPTLGKLALAIETNLPLFTNIVTVIDFTVTIVILAITTFWLWQYLTDTISPFTTYT
jgi:hypothetical protein